MFKVSYNRAVVRIRVQTVTPLSIRAGETGLDPTSSDLACVRTHHRIYGTTVYIPGSSFKGVIRSTSEGQLRGRQFRHLGAGGPLDGACDPARHSESCAQHKDHDTAAVHRANCVACRLFGSLSMRGRCAPRDLFPFSCATTISEEEQANVTRANKVEVRHGVLIGRVSGSVEVGPFDQEMVPAGITFHGEISLQNYQVWQLGLLFSALEELTEGFAQLGSSTTRGLGVVRVEVDSLLHEQRSGGEDRPKGVGDLVDDRTRRAYGLFAESRLPNMKGTIRGLSRRFAVAKASEVAQWRDAGMQALAKLDAQAQRHN